MVQDVVVTVNHKIPKFLKLRRLSRENVIKVILEQYEALLSKYLSKQLVKEMVSGVVSSRYIKRMNDRKEQHKALRVLEARPDQNEIDEESEHIVLL
ncbi:hypothetical protein PoB_001134600 [Plakobranchus ocellatus]|uniref:Uncharacterized protein n=1 Tax=Plakobranchus ocellatus TaxID=259542 RepID=A0AAV3YNG1_9GAST|nr:hypothetical protein PoB_001134600 [Plakobranchus ocellatus]